MAMVLIETDVETYASKWGTDIITIPAGHWVQIRTGLPESPSDMLLRQVPEGKEWYIQVNVSIKETDA